MARILPCDLNMASNRLDTLKSMCEQDPASAFARYGLAMEYVNLGRFDEALDEFHTLLGSNPDYSAGYYHAGRTLERVGKIDEARAMYEKGIEATTRTGDAHTRSELQAALDLL
ncbi:MAG TPA: tetratricopeptide repeat protein [Bryobacteraceae bacterium]|nr:tetratricopeptide repeat protein [Bryobacteraceae bacterium]